MMEPDVIPNAKDINSIINYQLTLEIKIILLKDEDIFWTSYKFLSNYQFISILVYQFYLVLTQ